jgi:hypothetical protein
MIESREYPRILHRCMFLMLCTLRARFLARFACVPLESRASKCRVSMPDFEARMSRHVVIRFPWIEACRTRSAGCGLRADRASAQTELVLELVARARALSPVLSPPMASERPGAIAHGTSRPSIRSALVLSPDPACKSGYVACHKRKLDTRPCRSPIDCV